MKLQKVETASDLTDEERALLRAYAKATDYEKTALYVILKKHGMKKPIEHRCTFRIITNE